MGYDESLARLHLDDVYGPGAADLWRRQLDQPLDTLSLMTKIGLQVREESPQGLRLRTMNQPTYQDLGTVTALIEHAYALRKDAPGDAVVILEGAIHSLKERSDWPSEARAYLLARAWIYLGNSHRLLSDFDAAHEAFCEASKNLTHAYPDPELAGMLVGFEGTLYRDQRLFGQAISKLEAALTHYERLPPNPLQLETEITLALVYEWSGRFQECIRSLKALLERHPQSAFPPGSLLASMQNLALCYAYIGRPEKAWPLYHKVRRLAEEEGNRLDLIKVDWLEAEIYKSQGDRTLAAAGFREVTAKLMAAGIPVDAATATLSQAEMYLELGDTKAAAELAEDLVPIFQSKGIHREATMAGLIVVEDLRREAATVAQVQELTRQLRERGGRTG